MTFLESIKRMNVPRFFLVVFIICTIISGLYSVIPIYEPPSVFVTTQEIPEYQLSITNDSWIQPERILLANLTPKLEDPSWYSSERRQREYNARVETINDTTTLYFNDQTTVNETYTWSDHARWDLVWPFAVLNYTELTVEWHIQVLRGNITVDSLFTIARGSKWQNIRGSYVTNSHSEMNATAPAEITLVSIASNFTEQFNTIDVGILWVDLDIEAAQGSIVAVDNVEVWINTDEPLCQVTLDFQSLYGQSLFSNPSIVSQWLGSDSTYDYHDIGDEIGFYLKSITPISPYRTNYMLVTRSTQSAYLVPGNYSLTLGWTDTYSIHDKYLFNLTLHENTSVLMNIPLPLNPVLVEVSTSQIPGTIGVNYLGRVNISSSEDFLFIITECDTFSIRFSIPGYGWEILEVETSEGIWSEILIDLKLVPLNGILFTQQQITGMGIATIFAALSLVMFLYRWRSSKKESYLTLVPLLLFFTGLVLPWYGRTEMFSGAEYTTYLSSILGYRIWSSNGLYLTTDSLFFSQQSLTIIFASMYTMVFVGLLMAACLFEPKDVDILFILSIVTLVTGSIALFTMNGLPLLGFWSMLTVPPLSYLIKRRTEGGIEETLPVEIPEQQSN